MISYFAFLYRDHSSGRESKRTIIRSYFGIMRIEEYPQRSIQKSSQYFLDRRDDSGREITGGPDIELTIDTREMSHGTTLHGRQFRSRFRDGDGREYGVPPRVGDDLRMLGASSVWESIALAGARGSWDPTGDPLTYYHRTGPVGAIFREAFVRTARPRVGMVGLGTGSGAAYCIADQTMTFYEIDPAVRAMIEAGKHFTYVTDARKRDAKIDIVMGDARLMLDRYSGTKYDLLLIDAFSSDSIPVHLLTVESVKLYRGRLAEKGVLALHVSNRYLRLEPIVAAIAEKNGMVCRIWEDRESGAPGKTESSWVVLADSEADLGKTFSASPWEPIPLVAGVSAWTDDYQDILRVIRSKELQTVRWHLGLPTPIAE